MQLSYWEIKNWFTDVDFLVVGSGIVGINAAIRLRERFPSARILIVERGQLPQGASTKNAGFACFGSLSEMAADLRTAPPEDVFALVKKRWDGLNWLRTKYGDSAIGFKNYGGYELFLDSQPELFDECLQSMDRVNKLLRPLFKSDVFSVRSNTMKFANVKDRLLYNPFEGQVETGKLMLTLLKDAAAHDIQILNSATLDAFEAQSDGVLVRINGYEFKTGNLLFATNGFSARITNQRVAPARAQVLVTKPIDDLHLKGTFHLDEGFYYFRNIDNRILLGGARNLNIQGETTEDFGTTQQIQDRLEQLLSEVILPGQPFEIDHRWSGIMGMGIQKSPIVEALGDRVFCGVRLGGMGVAIGSLIGRELAELV